MTACISARIFAWYPYLAGIGGLLAQWLLLGRFLGGKRANACLSPLFLLSCAAIFLPLPVFCKYLLLAGLLFSYGTAFCGKSAALFSALLAVGLMQLSYGVLQPVLAALFPLLFPFAPALCGIAFMLAGDFLSIGLALFCGKALCRRMAVCGSAQALPLLAVPLLLAFSVSGAISHSFYGNTAAVPSPTPAPLHLAMLLVQLLAFLSLSCLLHIRQEFLALQQQERLQAQYALAAQARWRGTKALRHDIKNHIAVISGLLEKGDAQAAQAYAAALGGAAAALSPAFQTGRPACDVLLAEKAALAHGKGIYMDGFLQFPDACPITDFDFCVLLSNALDNAIHACGKLPANARSIHISSQIQGDFLLLSFENSFDGNPAFRAGTGLSNIRQIAEKYGGTTEIRTTDTVFQLHILLDIS